MAKKSNLDDGMIDLGKEVDVCSPMGDTSCSDTKSKKNVKIHYPSLYISDVAELDDLPDGEFYFLAKAQVTRHTEETPIAGTDEDDEEEEGNMDGKGCNCEITVMALKPVDSMPASTADGLEKSLSSIEKKKMAEMDNEEE